MGKGRLRARASFRDSDGRRGFVTRYGRSRAQTERRLHEALADAAEWRRPLRPPTVG